jgi:homoserine dehydrogenase
MRENVSHPAPLTLPLCRAALVGFGTVGQAVARILVEHPPPGVRLTHIFNRRIQQKRVPWVPADVRWTDDIEDVLTAPVDILIELVGGVQPSGAWVRRALESGRSVVTANKQLIATEGTDLARLAEDRGAELRFEGSVAGGIPILSALRDGLVADRISRVSGILNGTCNFVLTSMEDQGSRFGDALREAQARGYAEADPTDDIEGHDARAKLAILCGAALRADVVPGDLTTRSISMVETVDFVHARRLGCTIRQISQAEWDAGEPGLLHASVRPSLVPIESPLSRVSGSQNIVVVRGEYGGETVFSGSGAGGGPTSVAVVSDIAAIARHRQRVAVAAASATASTPTSAERSESPDVRVTPRRISGEFVTPHYLRFVVRDRPGIIAAIAGAMEQHAINIDAVLQLPAPSKEALPFVVTVEACRPAALAAAMDRIGALDFHVQPPVDFPILAETPA